MSLPIADITNTPALTGLTAAGGGSSALGQLGQMLAGGQVPGAQGVAGVQNFQMTLANTLASLLGGQSMSGFADTDDDDSGLSGPDAAGALGGGASRALMPFQIALALGQASPVTGAAITAAGAAEAAPAFNAAGGAQAL